MFRGLMDDVLISDSAFSAAQIVSSANEHTSSIHEQFLFRSTNATQGKLYMNSVNESAMDPNGDRVIYSKVMGPVWLNVTTDGELVGVPTGNDVGTNHFTVRASDLAGESTFAVITLVVNSSLTGGPELLARYAFNGTATDGSGNAQSRDYNRVAHICGRQIRRGPRSRRHEPICHAARRLVRFRHQLYDRSLGELGRREMHFSAFSISAMTPRNTCS